jgi:hypothetical protein
MPPDNTPFSCTPVTRFRTPRWSATAAWRWSSRRTRNGAAGREVEWRSRMASVVASSGASSAARASSYDSASRGLAASRASVAGSHRRLRSEPVGVWRTSRAAAASLARTASTEPATSSSATHAASCSRTGSPSGSLPCVRAITAARGPGIGAPWASTASYSVVPETPSTPRVTRITRPSCAGPPSAAWPRAPPSWRQPGPSWRRRRRLLGRRPTSQHDLLAPLGQELERALGQHRLEAVAARQRLVGLAVGDVDAELAVLGHHRLAADRVGAELAQRRLGGHVALRRRGGTDLGLARRGERVVEGDGEQLLLGLDGAVVLALLHVRAVAAVVGHDGLTVGRIDAQRRAAAVRTPGGPGRRDGARAPSS